MTTTIPTTDLLTEDMLARFDERAPLTTGRTGSSRRTSTSSGTGATSTLPCPTEFGGPGLSLAEVQPAPAPARLRRAGHRPGGQHALLLDRRRRRPVGAPATRRASGCWSAAADGDGVRRRSRRGGQRHPAAPVVDDGRARRRRLGDHRPQDLRLALAGLDLPRPPRHGHERPRRPRRSSTRSCPATPERYRIEQTWDVLGMRATESNDTILDHTFIPDEYVALVCPAGFAGAGHVPGRDLRVGTARLRDGLPRDRPARLRRDGARGCIAAHLGRADPLDGVPPGRAARGRRDAHRARGDRRLPRARRRRLVERRRPRDGVAAEDPRGEVLHREPGVAGRRLGPRPLRRIRHLHPQPDASSCSATRGSDGSTRATRC